MVKQLRDLMIQTVIALLIVLLVANIGNNGSLVKAFHDSVQLVKQSLYGQNPGTFYEVHGPAIWYSIRLVLMAAVVAVMLGLILALIKSRVRNRWLRGFIDFWAALFESVPDAMYVVITVVVVLFLIEQLHIDPGPVFPGNVDLTFNDTIVPAVALGLPGAFYLQRLFSLQLQDEVLSQYIVTARAKGLTEARIFYRHVLPNIYPTLIRSVPIVIGVILSSIIFAEFFFDYLGGIFFHLVTAAGWDMQSGIAATGWILGKSVPAYESGTLWVIGSLLVGLWFVFRLLSLVTYNLFYPESFQITPPPRSSKVQWWPIVTGGSILAVILFFALFPHLLTPYSASSMDMQIHPPKPWPFPPSAKHLLGTDDVGHDLLAEYLYGTWTTLGVTLLITVLTTFFSGLIATTVFASGSRWLRSGMHLVGRTVSAVPVLFVMFLVLYPRNHSMQALQHQTHLAVVHQAVLYIVCLVVLEMGRGSYAFGEQFELWSQFGFMEGVASVGQSRLRALFTHLKSWLWQYTLEFTFVEFARVMTIMVQLAALHIFLANVYNFVLFTLSSMPWRGVAPAFNTWISLFGQLANQYAFMSYSWLLYAPLLFFLGTTVSANLIGRGLRGKTITG